MLISLLLSLLLCLYPIVEHKQYTANAQISHQGTDQIQPHLLNHDGYFMCLENEQYALFELESLESFSHFCWMYPRGW